MKATANAEWGDRTVRTTVDWSSRSK